jgi:hypothetical protein
MKRILGLAAAIVVPLGLATTTHAQPTPYGNGAMGLDYGVSSYGAQPYGGFGLQYSQALPAGGIVEDQYGVFHVIPYVASAAPIAAVQPQPSARTSRSGYRRAVVQPRYQLPTGSLGSSAANGGILYSPEMRYQSYGSGYGVGPYGVIDHRMMWKW